MALTETESDPRAGFHLNTNRLAEDDLRNAHQAERIAARLVNFAGSTQLKGNNSATYRDAVIYAQGMATTEDPVTWAGYASLAGLVNCPKPIIRRTVRAILNELAS